MPVTIIAIGKRHDSWITEGLERYQKRLRKPYDVRWILLPHSTKEGVSGAEEESQRIKGRLDDADFVVVLDERGKMLSSPALSSHLDAQFSVGRNVILIIGGAYGVSHELRERANLVWSLSSLVFPHQLVRLILIEQLYRAQSISNGEPYHHE